MDFRPGDGHSQEAALPAAPIRSAELHWRDEWKENGTKKRGKNKGRKRRRGKGGRRGGKGGGSRGGGGRGGEHARIAEDAGGGAEGIAGRGDGQTDGNEASRNEEGGRGGEMRIRRKEMGVGNGMKFACKILRMLDEEVQRGEILQKTVHFLTGELEAERQQRIELENRQNRGGGREG